MKKAGMILGLIGAIIGIVIAVLAISAGVLVDAGFQALTQNGEMPEELQEMTTVVGRVALGSGIGGLIFSIVGLIGAVMVNKSQKTAGILMLIGGIVGFIFLLAGYVVPGILLIIGGVLALAAKKEAK